MFVAIIRIILLWTVYWDTFFLKELFVEIYNSWDTSSNFVKFGESVANELVYEFAYPRLLCCNTRRNTAY